MSRARFLRLAGAVALGLAAPRVPAAAQSADAAGPGRRLSPARDRLRNLHRFRRRPALGRVRRPRRGRADPVRRRRHGIWTAPRCTDAPRPSPAGCWPKPACAGAPSSPPRCGPAAAPPAWRKCRRRCASWAASASTSCRSTTCSTGAPTCRCCANGRPPVASATSASAITRQARMTKSRRCCAPSGWTSCRSTMRWTIARPRSACCRWPPTVAWRCWSTGRFGGGGLLRRLAGRPLPSWAADIGATSWAQVLLKFVLSHPAVTCAIPGTGRAAHMRDNLAAGMAAPPPLSFWNDKA
ncbi:putative exported protein [Bordetella bronchiseptica MO211]|nr:putative exported protein [Bordetella bronchiseptica MO211]